MTIKMNLFNSGVFHRPTQFKLYQWWKYPIHVQAVPTFDDVSRTDFNVIQLKVFSDNQTKTDNCE